MQQCVCCTSQTESLHCDACLVMERAIFGLRISDEFRFMLHINLYDKWKPLQDQNRYIVNSLSEHPRCFACGKLNLHMNWTEDNAYICNDCLRFVEYIDGERE